LTELIQKQKSLSSAIVMFDYDVNNVKKSRVSVKKTARIKKIRDH